VNYKANKYTIFYIRGRWKNGTQNSEVLKTNSLQFSERSSVRFNLETSLNPKLTLRARCELSGYSEHGVNKTRGFMFYTDLTLKPSSFPVNVSSRMCWFNTHDYESRIYTLEKDVMYSYAVTGFSGEGYKFYLLAAYAFKKKLKLQCRYSVVTYFDRTTIGSGWSEVNSDRLHQINLLISYRFR